MLKNKKIIVISALSVLLIAAGVSLCTGSANDNNSKTVNTQNAEQSFADVAKTDWFYSDVGYASDNGFMQGTSDALFSPNDPTTRGMLVTILWRLDGEAVGDKNIFDDVTDDKYYYNAVAWASQKGIVNGYNDTMFNPNDNITREQLAAILCRYVKYKGLDVSSDANISHFNDFKEISDYAVDPMKWAYGNEIITGVTEDIINPKGNATRCQIAAVLKRLCVNIINKDDNNSPDQTSNTETTAPNITSKPSSGSGSSSGGKIKTEEPSKSEDIKEPPVIRVNTTDGKIGDKVKVELELQKNPGILGMILSLEYDDTALKLLNAENGEAAENVLTLTPSKELNSGVKFVWDGLELETKDIKNGILLTLEFEITDSAVIGKRYPLKFSYLQGDIVDNNLSAISPSIHQGFIEIKENE